MYSERITQQEIEQLARELAARGTPWTPTPHSPSDCQRARTFFDELTKWSDRGEPDGFLRPLTPVESEWIRNERLLCKLDFNYALTRYCHIRDWKGELRLFDPNIAQRIKIRLYAEQEERGLAVLLLALKARQLGSSTLAEAVIWHKVTFQPRTYAIVGSNDPAKSSDMFDMVERMWEHMPWWLKPARTAYSTGTFVEFGGIDSLVSIQHGTQKSGIGRGATPNAGHLSEIADYDNPEDLIDASLMRAMHEHPGMYLELESTAKGRGNWWHQTWEENVAAGPGAKLLPTFLPWYVGSDIYPTEAWLRRRPIPRDWRPADSTLAHAAAAADYVSQSPLLQNALGEGWRLPPHQQWFYEVERAAMARKGQLGLFLREMCATPEEAFASVSEQIFSIELLDTHRGRLRAPMLVRVLGPDIPQRILPETRGLRPREAARLVWAPGETRSLHWELEIFGRAPAENFNPMGWMLVWEPPAPGEEYAIGIDCSEGIGQDRTTICVVRRGDPGAPDEQVAEWCQDSASGLDAWSVALATAAWYECGGESRVTVIPELAKDGPSLVNELRKRGWRRWHQRRSWTKTGSSSPTSSIGWLTTQSSRPVLMGQLIRSMRDDWFIVRSRWLMGELEDLEDHNGKVEHRAGAHDDRVLACALALLELAEKTRRGEASRRQTTRREAEELSAREVEWLPPGAALPVSAEHAGWEGWE